MMKKSILPIRDSRVLSSNLKLINQPPINQILQHYKGKGLSQTFPVQFVRKLTHEEIIKMNTLSNLIRWGYSVLDKWIDNEVMTDSRINLRAVDRHQRNLHSGLEYYVIQMGNPTEPIDVLIPTLRSLLDFTTTQINKEIDLSATEEIIPPATEEMNPKITTKQYIKLLKKAGILLVEGQYIPGNGGFPHIHIYPDGTGAKISHLPGASNTIIHNMAINLGAIENALSEIKKVEQYDKEKKEIFIRTLEILLEYANDSQDE